MRYASTRGLKRGGNAKGNNVVCDFKIFTFYSALKLTGRLGIDIFFREHVTVHVNLVVIKPYVHNFLRREMSFRKWIRFIMVFSGPC